MTSTTETVKVATTPCFGLRAFVCAVLAAACLTPAFAGKRRTASGAVGPSPTQNGSQNIGPQVSSQSSYSAPTAAENQVLSRILSMEEQRQSDQQLLNALNHPSIRVRRAAILALGRIGDPTTIGELAALMNRRRFGEKREVAFALGLFPDEVATTVLVQHLAMQKDTRVLNEIFLALGRQGTEKHMQAVTKPIREGGPASLLEASCHALGMLWSKNSEEWAVPEGLMPQLARAVSSRQPHGAACAFAVSRYKGSDLIPSGAFIKAALENGSNIVKAYVAKALARTKDTESIDAAIYWASPKSETGLRIESLKTVAAHPYAEKEKELLANTLGEKNPPVLVQTLIAVASHGPQLAELSPKIDLLLTKHPSTWVRSHALRALGETDLTLARKRMEEVMRSGPPALLPAAVSVLAIAPAPDDTARIANFLQHENPRIVVEMMDSLANRYEGEWPPEWRAALKKSIERADPAICSAGAQVVSRFGWKDFAPSLTGALGKLTQADHVEPKIAVISALGSTGSSSQVAALQAALGDSQKAVVQAAAEALKTITGQDFSQRIPTNSRFPTSSFEMGEINQAVRSEVVLKTTRGEIVMQMQNEAPLTALNFVRLVKRKFYDGLSFHRVIPHFVAQGGDPRGDGYGGSGYLIRDEFDSEPQVRATVGIATSGRDTGGSQFYINLAPNRHLDGRYTVFAKVVHGIDVADRLEEGDRILSARVR